MGYSPWSDKESGTTERAHTDTTTSVEYSEQQYICIPTDTGKQSPYVKWKIAGYKTTQEGGIFSFYLKRKLWKDALKVAC